MQLHLYFIPTSDCFNKLNKIQQLLIHLNIMLRFTTVLPKIAKNKKISTKNLSNLYPLFSPLCYHRFSNETYSLFFNEGQLMVRNSQNYDLKLVGVNSQSNRPENISISISNSSTLADVKLQLSEQVGTSNIVFRCEDNNLIALKTPLSALLHHQFFIIINEIGIVIEGAYSQTQIISNKQQRTARNSQQLKNLELPLITQRQFENYLKRIAILAESKRNLEFHDCKLKIKNAQAQDILVQALMDPNVSYQNLIQLETSWLKHYKEAKEIQKKYDQALLECAKIVRRKMLFGIGLLSANIGFIWSGTYIFYSWDIIEPLAYFSSSLVGIILTLQFLKIKKPYSNKNYREYMMKRYMGVACEKVGLREEDYEKKMVELHQAQSNLKDAIIRKL